MSRLFADICDDCCSTTGTGVSYQAQAFNFIRALDPYHVITGAANCADSFIWSDTASTPVAPTANLSLPVIAFGDQPATQLSLDYILQENYGGNLASKAGDGTWAGGRGGDGNYRNGMQFEPICNCPGVDTIWGTRGITGQENKLLSESWLGAVSGGMLDLLVFIEQGCPWTEAVMTSYARQAAEISPSFRGRGFRVEQQEAALTVDASALTAPTSPPHSVFGRVGGEYGWQLRATVWEEEPAAPAVICAHVVVTNLDLDDPLLFQFELGGRAPPTSNISAIRIFGPGRVTGHLTTTDGSAWLPVQAWLGPAETGIYRIGCQEPAKGSTNLASVPIESQALNRVAGWSTVGCGGENALVQMTSDAAVAVEGRHSLKVVLPSADPLVFPFPGKQLSPPPPMLRWGATVGGSITLLPGHTYHISLAVQATPPGTVVELLGGLWRTTTEDRNEYGADDCSNYTGHTFGKVVVTSQGWQDLNATVAVPRAVEAASDVGGANVWNGTALQLRVTPPGSERGWGATAWLDKASVVDVAGL